MKKLNKVASLFASAALATCVSGAFAQTVDNWVNPNGLTWMNGTRELCWRDANWTPATAKEECDGALKKAVAAAPAPEPAPSPAPAPAPAPAPEPAPRFHGSIHRLSPILIVRAVQLTGAL